MSTNDILRELVDKYDDNYTADSVETDCAIDSEQVSEVDYEQFALPEFSKAAGQHGQEIVTHEEEMTAESSAKTRKKRWAGELEALQFTNPGDKTSKMLPDSLDIIDRNRSRRAAAAAAAAIGEMPQQTAKDESLQHDKTGKVRFFVNGERKQYDLCDCLDPNCNGCQWPCKQCKSRKCMIGCRQGRKDIIGKIEEMYTITGNEDHRTVINPYYMYPIKH